MIGAALCAVLSAWAFWPMLGYGFVNLEDYWLVLNNPHLRSLDFSQLRWMATSLEYGTYQPLGWLSYALIFRIQGLNPAAYHMASWLGHAACATLFYFIVQRLLRIVVPRLESRHADLAAFAAAATWALHPHRVEQVAWVTGLPDVLATAFYLAAILAYLGAGSRGRRLTLCFLLYLASALFRWKGVALPVVLLALDVFALKRPFRREIGLEKIPFLLLAAVFGAVNARSKLMLAPGHAFDLGWRTLAGPVFYLGKLLAPVHLTVDYWVPSSPLLAAVFVALTAASCSSRSRRASYGAAWAVFVAAALPSLLMSFRGLVVAHDRATYLPALSLHALLGAGVALALGRGVTLRRAVMTGGAALLAGLIAMTRAQLPVWRNSESLWRHVLSQPVPPDYARLSLAHALLEQGRRDEAAAELRAHLRRFPKDARVSALAAELGVLR